MDPHVIVGGLQFSPDDPAPTPVIAIRYTDEADAIAGAKLLVSLQNGTCPLKMGQSRPVFMGDTNIRVGFIGGQENGQILCEVMSKADPRHMTCGFYAASLVALEQVKAFKQLIELNRSYTFTVTCNERVLNNEIDVVKYTFSEKGVPS